MTNSQETSNLLSQTFGHINGVPIGMIFGTRKKLMAIGLHNHPQKGISTAPFGATCIVINGEYPDQDHGNHLIYIGSGSKNSAGKIYQGQQWDTGPNSFLLKNFQNGKPVRVVRGSKGNPRWSPYKGFSYDGLYQVVDASRVPVTEPNGGTYKQCQFRLERLPGQRSLHEYSVARKNAFAKITKRKTRGKRNAGKLLTKKRE